MVNFMLMITADLDNIASLQPQGGCDDPNFSYFFKLKCGRCGEVSQKETSVTLSDTVEQAKSTTHLVQKCKFCGRDGTVTMNQGKGYPLTNELSEEGKYAPMMLFDFRGFEPLDYVFGGGWSAISIAGTKYEDIDLSGEDFSEYDEKGECPVMISNPRSKFEVVK